MKEDNIKIKTYLPFKEGVNQTQNPKKRKRESQPRTSLKFWRMPRSKILTKANWVNFDLSNWLKDVEGGGGGKDILDGDVGGGKYFGENVLWALSFSNASIVVLLLETNVKCHIKNPNKANPNINVSTITNDHSNWAYHKEGDSLFAME